MINPATKGEQIVDSTLVAGLQAAGFTVKPSTDEVPSGTNGTSKRIPPKPATRERILELSEAREKNSLGVPSFAVEGTEYTCTTLEFQERVSQSGSDFGVVQVQAIINGKPRPFCVLVPTANLIPQIGTECKVKCNKTTNVDFPLSMQIVA